MKTEPDRREHQLEPEIETVVDLAAEAEPRAGEGRASRVANVAEVVDVVVALEISDSDGDIEIEAPQ